MRTGRVVFKNTDKPSLIQFGVVTETQENGLMVQFDKDAEPVFVGKGECHKLRDPKLEAQVRTYLGVPLVEDYAPQALASLVDLGDDEGDGLEEEDEEEEKDEEEEDGDEEAAH